MRCIACNTELTDFEATRKDKRGDFIDLCNNCFIECDYEFETYDRIDLLSENDIQYGENDGT